MQTEQDRTPSGKSLFPVPERFPVFPLPNVVFFPRMYLLLHIFEPRYRTMVADAVGGGQCIGMVLLKEGWEQDYYGNPPVFETGCVGRLVSVQPLPDGRYNILLQGLHRFQIQEQFFEKSYREVRAILKPGEADSSLDPSIRAGLIQILERYLNARKDGHQWRELVHQDADDELFVNGLATYLDLPPLEKQFLVEADSLRQRARRLHDLIQFKLDECGGAKGWG